MAARTRRRSSRQGLSKVGSLLMASLSREQASMLLFADLCSRWCEVVGPKLARRSSPGDLLDGTLFVIASDPLLCQEITMRGGDIASRVKEKWDLEVTGVSARVGRPRRRITSEKRARTCEPLRLGTDEVAACLEELRPAIGRDDVASDLARLMALYKKKFGSEGRPARRKT
ncbi:MAG: DUF721 domain-containing protein [Thermovirga sp.]|nr:DUF721 domain-containing protein [Thermovirga sp.]